MPKRRKFCENTGEIANSESVSKKGHQNLWWMK